MIKIVTLLLFLTLIICPNAYSHTFTAMKTGKNPAEVVLQDRATGQEWVVIVGDEIDGYRIDEITEDYVTISKMGDNRTINETRIPLEGGLVIQIKP